MDFIPIENHTFYYYQFMLLLVVLVYVQSLQTTIDDNQNISSKKTLGIISVIFTLGYIGLRPISVSFGDMIIYSRTFDNYQLGAPPNIVKDVLFEYFLYYSSKIMSGNLFFFLCAFLYIIPLYLACKNILKEYWFYGFLMLIISFTFLGYGVNGIRNGIASSIFLYGISFINIRATIVILLVSLFVHKSLILPIVAYALVHFYKNTKFFLYFWAFAIPISLVSGTFFSSLLLGLGLVEEDRLLGYFDEFDIDGSGGVEMKIGFRWDFILYSATGVVSGYYFLIKKKFVDAFYSKLFNTYLVSNGIWILIIRANFSNRFVYLSWFFLGLVLIYPLLKLKFFSNQHVFVGKVILLYFMFTYLLNVILA